MFPQLLHVEALIPDITVSGDMVLKKQLGLNEELRVGLWPYLKKKKKDSLYVCVCVM